MEPEQNTNMPPETRSSAGPIIGAIIILAVILFGALFFWGERSENRALNEKLQEINTQSESDEVVDIEADLEATDVESVDYDLNPENYNAS
jgi:uncharacterized protein HemX